MVVRTPERTDRLLQALSDGTRRDIVRRVLHREHSVSSLAADYPMSFAAVQKHVAILERAELVRKRRHGREQLVSGDFTALEAVRRLLDSYADVWRARIDQMDQILAEAPATDILSRHEKGIDDDRHRRSEGPGQPDPAGDRAVRRPD